MHTYVIVICIYVYIYNTHTTLYSLHGFICCLHWNWKVSSAQSPLSGPEKAEATQLLQKARWVFRDAIPIAKRCRIPPDHTCLRHSIPTWHTHTHTLCLCAMLASPNHPKSMGKGTACAVKPLGLCCEIGGTGAPRFNSKWRQWDCLFRVH